MSDSGRAASAAEKAGGTEGAPPSSHREQALPRRFYTDASASREHDGSWQLRLDGRPARTPAKRALALPDGSLAEAVAAEWRAQVERIDPASMPLTRIVNSVLDGVTDRADEVRQDIVRYAANDLLCYRAEGPEGLCERQRRHWDPVLAWAASELAAPLEVGRGIVHVAQPPSSLVAIGQLLAPLDPFRLGAVHVVTTVTGSAVLALALLRRRLDVPAVWAAAEVDEHWQAECWGIDTEAEQRSARRRREVESAGLVLRTLDNGTGPSSTPLRGGG